MQQAGLERQPQRCLHDAGCPGGGYLSERRIHLAPCWVKPSRSIHAAKLRVIEGVVHFPTDGKESPFTLERNFLDERNVHIAEARSADNILWCIARAANRRSGEYRSIEPAEE